MNLRKKLPEKFIRHILLIVTGAMLQAVSYVLFLAPYKIVPGGVYGISIIIHYLSDGWFSFAPNGLPIGTVALFFNIPLMILASKKLGLLSGWKTILTFVLVSFFTDLLSALVGDFTFVTDDTILSCFYGAVILGLGVFMIFAANATSAGTDVPAKLIARTYNLKVSNIIIIIDSIIVLLGLVAFQDWKVPLYSWIVIFLYGKTVDMLQVKNPNCMLFIITDNVAVIRSFILEEIKRGGTLVKAEGLYTHNEKDMIFLVVSKKEAAAVEAKIKIIDSKAFLVITDAHEITGNDFHPDPKWDYRMKHR